MKDQGLNSLASAFHKAGIVSSGEHRQIAKAVDMGTLYSSGPKKGTDLIKPNSKPSGKNYDYAEIEARVLVNTQKGENQ
jgi:hypothetical protein